MEEAFLLGFQKEANVTGVDESLMEATGETVLEEGLGALGGHEIARRIGDSSVTPKVNVPSYLKGRPARIGGLFAGALASNILTKQLVDQLRPNKKQKLKNKIKKLKSNNK